MYKTILAVLTGSESDNATLCAGYAAGTPFAAHMECLRIRPGPEQVAFGVAAMDLSGAVTPELFDAVVQEDKARTERARTAFEEFRTRLSIPVADGPGNVRGFTILWSERIGDVVNEVVKMGRANDLVALAGDTASFLSVHEIGSILMGCGRPVLLSGSRAIASPFSTIAIAWKQSAEAARAITVAMPLLELSRKVLVLTAVEADDREREERESAAMMEKQLRWHGLAVEVHLITSSPAHAPESVIQTAREVGADLMVMGGYGQSRLRQMVFGGFTHHVLRGAEIPVLLFH